MSKVFLEIGFVYSRWLATRVEMFISPRMTASPSLPASINRLFGANLSVRSPLTSARLKRLTK